MRFNKFIKLLAEMSLDKALEVFGLQGDVLGNVALIKKKYRDLSLQNHPDHGGDVEKMKDINVAYAVLKTSKAAPSSSRMNWDDLHKKYQGLASAVKASLLAGFKPEIFITYFNQFINDKFEFEFTSVYPKESEKSPSSAGFRGEFFTSNRDTVFELDIYVNLTDLAKSGLGYQNFQYPLIITTYGFHNNKKQKLQQRDYTFSNDHSFFSKPENIFPSVKLKKIFSGVTSQREFKRRDMFTFMQKKLKADVDSEWSRIPIVDDYKLTLYRSVFMKHATWMVNGIYKKMARINNGFMITLPETEETAKFLFDLQKQCSRGPATDEAVIKRVNAFLKAYKEQKAAKINVYA